MGHVHRERRIDGFAVFAAFSITIVRLPWLISYSGNLEIAVTVVILFGVLALALSGGSFSTNPLRLTPILLVLTLAVALVRGMLAGVGPFSLKGLITQSILMLLFAMLGGLLIATAETRARVNQRLVGIALAPAVYAACSVILYFFGFASNEANPTSTSVAQGSANSILSLIGLPGQRVALALEPSINDFGIMAGAGLAAALVLVATCRGRPRRLAVVVAAASLVALALSDTHGAIIAGLVGLLLVMPKRRPPVALVLFIIVPFSFWIATEGVGLYASGLNVLSRGLQASSTGDERTVIWQACEFVLSHASPLHWLFGWGSEGEATSRASTFYGFQVFSQIPNPTISETQNLGLQTLLDSGLVGMGALVLATTLAAYRLDTWARKTRNPAVHAMLVAFVVLFLCGTSEAAPTYLVQTTILYALMVMGCAGALAGNSSLREAALRARMAAQLVRAAVPTGSGGTGAHLGLRTRRLGAKP